MNEPSSRRSSPLYELARKIRDTANLLEEHELFRSHKVGNWQRLSSCLDAVEDTELACIAYRDRPFPEDLDEQHLRIYGLLQALFAQQNAVGHISEQLGLEYDPKHDFPDLFRIRQVRNHCVGHATASSNKGKLSYSFISRPTIRHEGFELLVFSENGNFHNETVEPLALIDKQTDVLEKVLVDVLEALHTRCR